MTTEELKAAYLEWIEDYTNNRFNESNLPGGVKLALNQLIELDPMMFNISSESIGDLSQSFSNEGGIPKYIYNWINPYKKLRSL